MGEIRTNTVSREIISVTNHAHMTVTLLSDLAPVIITDASVVVRDTWDDFFRGHLVNAHTRKAYLRAARQFLRWAEQFRITKLNDITPGLVGRYFDGLRMSTPSKKVHLAALRAFFNKLVLRHIIETNPALSVRTERYSVVEGRTPEITVEQSRRLLKSIPSETIIDFRDRAVIAMLVYTAARASAIAHLRIKDFVHDGTQFNLHFGEKRGKARIIPVRQDLQRYIEEYLLAANLSDGPNKDPLFRTILGRQGTLTDRSMNGVDIWRMVKRRLTSASLPTIISPHSFRACAATDLLLQEVPLENVQQLLGHADARTTRLYDRRQKQVTRNIVERISV